MKFNPFTAKDTVWHTGIITHPEINLINLLQVSLCVLPSGLFLVERSCLYGAGYYENWDLCGLLCACCINVPKKLCDRNML